MNATKSARNAKSQEAETQVSRPSGGKLRGGMAIAAASMLAVPVAKADLTNEVSIPTFNVSLSLAQTTEKQTDSVNGFNPALGTLDSVTLLLNGTGSFSSSESGLFKSPSSSVALDNYFDTKNNALNGGNPVSQIDYTFSFDSPGKGSSDSSKSFNWTSTETFTSPSDLSLFDNGKVTLYQSAVLTDITQLLANESSSNCKLGLEVSEKVTGDIFYRYTPCSVPEPAEAGILLTGAVAAGALSMLRRREDKQSD
jgi:hypothetical protein